jgi:hypothetical protein
MLKWISINLDLLSGKIIHHIEFEEIYSGKSLIIFFEDGTILQVDSVNDGGVFAEASTPIIEKN